MVGEGLPARGAGGAPGNLLHPDGEQNVNGHDVIKTKRRPDGSVVVVGWGGVQAAWMSGECNGR